MKITNLFLILTLMFPTFVFSDSLTLTTTKDSSEKPLTNTDEIELKNVEDKCSKFLSEPYKDLIWQELVKLVTEEKNELGISSKVSVFGHGFKYISSTEDTHICAVSFTVDYTSKISKFYGILFKTNKDGTFKSLDVRDIIIADAIIPKKSSNLQNQHQEGSH